MHPIPKIAQGPGLSDNPTWCQALPRSPQIFGRAALWAGCLLGLVSLLLSAQEYIPPQELDGSGLGAQQDSLSGQLNDIPGANLSELNPEAREEQVAAILVQELLNMIPAKLEDQSAVRQELASAVSAFRKQDFNQASELLGQIASSNPGFPPADLLRATLSYAVRDAENGLALLERAAIDHPSYPGIYSAFGRLALNQGRISDGLAQFEKCARLVAEQELEPQAKLYFEQQYLDGLIDVAMRQRRLTDAREYLEIQMGNLPGNLKVLMSFAELEFLEGNLQKSQQFLQTVKQKYSGARAPETILATWFDQQGNREQAGQWIKAAAEKYAQDMQVQLEYASYLVNIEDFPLASKVINDAEKIGNETAFSRNLKGRIAFCNESFGVAEAHYKAISDAQPNNFDAINMYALSLIESKDPEKRRLAREVATRTFRALPDNGVAAAALGYIQVRLGDLNQARELLGMVNLSMGMSPEIDYFIAAYLEAAGEKDRALMVLNSILEREGPFLYRKAAKKMHDRLKAADSSLPDPNDK
jgi:predicted Zn-dependent protease